MLKNRCYKLFSALIVIAMTVHVRVAFADQLFGEFNLYPDLTLTSPVGEVTFTLNADGTIAASLTSSAGIRGFGFDSVRYIPASNFSSTESSDAGWGDVFGMQRSGLFNRYVIYGQHSLTHESWTLGHPGDFTSVWQALGGGTSTVDFFLYTRDVQQFGANAHPSTVPEPSTFGLLALGAVGLVIGEYGRRRLRVTA